MAKRRERRRRKRLQRRERTPQEIEAAREARAEGEASEEERDVAPVRIEGVSWMGLAGSGMGFLSMAALAVIILIDPGDAPRTWALLFALPAAGFVPALWVSVRPSPLRLRIQRATVIGCLLLVLVSSITLGGPGLFIAFILMPATALLAIAAGWIFQGGRR